MTTDVPVDDAVRGRLALSLDTDDLVEAHRLAAQMRPYFGVAKVGLELFSAAGPDAIGSLRDLGYQVFLDLKLYDIPTTVNRADPGARRARRRVPHPARHGGVDMLKAGVEGLLHGAEAAGLEPPIALAVTVLTSDDSAPPHIVPEPGPRRRRGRLRRADPGRRRPPDRPRARAAAAPCGAGHPAPGRRPSTTRPAPPRPRRPPPTGADLLVIGRAVTQADDPVGRSASHRVGRRRLSRAVSARESAMDRDAALAWVEADVATRGEVVESLRSGREDLAVGPRAGRAATSTSAASRC